MFPVIDKQTRVHLDLLGTFTMCNTKSLTPSSSCSLVFVKIMKLLIKVKVKLPLCLIKHRAIRTYGGVGVWLHAFLTSALDGGELLVSRPGCFTPWGKSLCFSLDRRLAGSQSRSGRGGEEKNSQPLPGLEPQIIQPLA
jgi:hypothetical protein